MSGRLAPNAGLGDVELISATTAPFPPIRFAAVPASWSNGGVVPEFDLDLRCAGASGALTNVKVYDAKPTALVVADKTFTATHGTDTFTAAAHGLNSGDGPFRVSSSTTLPAGLSATVDYWIIYVDANSFKLAESRALAGAGTAVAITDNGTGTHTLADTADTKRMVWHSLGIAEATFALASAAEAATFPCSHSPRSVAYAVVWTGTASNAITATMSAVEDA